jgi:hypothetical protein
MEVEERNHSKDEKSMCQRKIYQKTIEYKFCLQSLEKRISNSQTNLFESWPNNDSTCQFAETQVFRHGKKICSK